MIVCVVDIGRIVDHLCLEVIVCFVDIGRIVDHHSFEMIVRFVDIGGIVDHHCLSPLFTIFKQSPPMELSNLFGAQRFTFNL